MKLGFQFIGALGALILFLSSCSQNEIKTLSWTEVVSEAPWHPRDSHGEFIFQDKMWILGGWTSPDEPNLLDVWNSEDGENWVKIKDNAPWIQSDLSVALPFKNRMWFMGGRSVPGTECSNDIWVSGDGAEWQKIPTGGDRWSPRLGASFVSFKDKIWVIGGTSDFYHNNDSTMMNDIWSSADGENWKLEVESAPWSKRAYSQAVVFDNKIWLIGGGERFPDVKTYNDVWCSDDGINWTEVTPRAPWGGRIWFSSVAYRDRLWILGGWDEQGNYGDVWFTENGRDWKEMKFDNIWNDRHELSAFVFKDKIWVAAGAAGKDYTLNSEVWNLFIPENFDLKIDASNLSDN